MNEFLLENQVGFESHFDSSSNIDCSSKHSSYIVSNIKTEKSLVYAPEINWYIKNNTDTNEVKLKTIKSLYDLRAKCFDVNNTKKHETTFSNEVVLVCQKVDFINILATYEDFVFKFVDINMSFDIGGRLGEFQVNQLTFETLGAFVVVIGSDLIFKKPGIFSINSYEKIKDTLEVIFEMMENYQYSDVIAYDSTNCSFSNRRICDVCTICTDICPTGSLSANHTTKLIEIDPLLCIKCAACVGACPAGSLQTYGFKNDIFESLGEFIQNKNIVITTESYIANNDFELPQNIFLVVLYSLNVLNYENMLAIVNQCAKEVCIVSDKISDNLKQTVNLINDICVALHNKQPIKLGYSFGGFEDISFSHLLYNPRFTTNTQQIEKFAQRLQFMVKGGDFGVIESPYHSFGKVAIDESKCTLCMGCVEVCKTKALSAKKDSFSLLLNPSLCVACGYCIEACSEKCITSEFGKIKLNYNWFTYNEVAHDDVFNCIECGKAFASAKAIQKVANIFSTLFLDENKKRTLYCCADCKPKLMLKEFVENNTKGRA